MRLRNVKGASKRIEQSPYIINNYKDYKGNFSSLFLNNNLFFLKCLNKDS